MKKSTFQLSIITAFIGLLVLAMPAMAKGVTASAQLDRSTIAVGKAALLNVIIKGDNHARVNLPKIDGLLIEPRGRSTNISFVNGHMSSSLTRRYVVIPDKEGDYTISPITVESNGKKITITQKPKIKVTQGVTPTGKNPNTSPNADPQLKPKDIARLEITGLKDHAVVGELIPVEIRAYFKHNSQVALSGIKSTPTLDGSSFTVKLESENPRQGTTTINGESYYVVIFNAAISPIKPGEFELPFTMDAIVQMRAKQQKRTRRRPSGFNDPFFDDAFDNFFTRTIKKEIHLTSPPFKMKVTPAPTEGRPDTFNGAVGQFTLSATAPTAPVRAGDPITLTVRVSGKGNLSRLKMPPMVDGSGWKTYPAKHHLENTNSLGTSGTLVFEQTIVPRNPSVTEIPAIELAYFNPTTEKYETTRTVPIPIKVLPGTNITEKTPIDSSLADTREKDSNAGQSQELTPISQLGWLRKKRLLDSPTFLTTTATITLSLLALAAGLAWTRRHNTPERKAATAKQHNIQSELKLMNDALASKDAAAFFNHAKRITQLHWAEKLDIAPEAVTTTDIPDTEARSIVEMADSLTFSGETGNSLNLTDWKRKVEKAILTLIIALGGLYLSTTPLIAADATATKAKSESEIQSAKKIIAEQFKIADHSGTSIALAANIAAAAQQANEPGVLEWATATLQLRSAEWALIGAAAILVIWATLITIGVWRCWKIKTHLLITLIAALPSTGGIYSYKTFTPSAHDAVIIYPSTAPDGKLLTTANLLVSPFDTAEIIGKLPPGAHVTLNADTIAPETNGYLPITDPTNKTTGWILRKNLREVGK